MKKDDPTKKHTKEEQNLGVVKPTWLVVGALLLAGCGSPDATAEVPQSATTGLVKGVVVDQAIRPIEGAEVTLDASRNAIAGKDGSYSFLSVQPGSYFLTATAQGFLPAQATVTVVAGAPSVVQFRLVPQARTDPFFQLHEFSGFAQVSAGILTPLLHQSLSEAGITPCECGFDVFPGTGLTAMMLEVTWEDSLSDPTGATEYLWQVAADDENGSTASGQGPSPIVRELGRLDFPAQNFQFTDAPSFSIRVYPDAAWPAMSQDYSVFLSLWYMGRPPADWSITGD